MFWNLAVFIDFKIGKVSFIAITSDSFLVGISSVGVCTSGSSESFCVPKSIPGVLFCVEHCGSELFWHAAYASVCESEFPFTGETSCK